MDPYYDIVRLFRGTRQEGRQLFEGTVHLEPMKIEVMGEAVEARLAGHIGADSLYDGMDCLVYMGEDNVVIAVW